MLRYLGQTVKVKVDRPLGSKHPEYNLIYPVNYGYIENTISGDGEEIDAYILGEFEPLKEYEGKVIGVILRSNDNENKLVVAKNMNSYSKSQIMALTEFQERFFKSDIVTYEWLTPAIRNTAKAIIKEKGKLLVLEENHDGMKYYHLPGGGIEFRETIEKALERELMEEIGYKILNFQYFTTITNLFELNGMKSHEICQIYNVTLDGNIKSLENSVMTGDLIESHFRLIDPLEFKNGSKKFFPESLIEML